EKEGDAIGPAAWIVQIMAGEDRLGFAEVGRAVLVDEVIGPIGQESQMHQHREPDRGYPDQGPDYEIYDPGARRQAVSESVEYAFHRLTRCCAALSAKAVRRSIPTKEAGSMQRRAGFTESFPEMRCSAQRTQHLQRIAGPARGQSDTLFDRFERAASGSCRCN